MKLLEDVFGNIAFILILIFATVGLLMGVSYLTIGLLCFIFWCNIGSSIFQRRWMQTNEFYSVSEGALFWVATRSMIYGPFAHYIPCPHRLLNKHCVPDWKRSGKILEGEEEDIYKEVKRVMSEEAKGWLHTPNLRLGGKTPEQAILDGEEFWVRDILRSRYLGNS